MFGNETEHKDDRERERIVFGTDVDWDDATGGMERIGALSRYMDSGISVETFSQLIEEGYVDPDGSQNRSPTMMELCEFGEQALQEYDGIDVVYGGYMISPNRGDSRITITSIDIEAAGQIPRDLLTDFAEEFGGADELRLDDNVLSAWWD